MIAFFLQQEVEEDEMPIASSSQVLSAGGQPDLPPLQPALWEEQPILTDAARQERENEATRRAAEKHKQAERERKFQEELVQFRRQIQTPTMRLPT